MYQYYDFRVNMNILAFFWGFGIGGLLHLLVDLPNPMGIPILTPTRRFSLKLWKSGKFEPQKFKDLYQEGLKEIINAKLEKRSPRLKEGAPPPGKVINIMDALKRSLEQSGSKKNTNKKPATKKK